MQTEGLGPDANDYAALGISVHQIFVACQSVEESIFGLPYIGGSRGDYSFLEETWKQQKY